MSPADALPRQRPRLAGRLQVLERAFVDTTKIAKVARASDHYRSRRVADLWIVR